MLQITNNSYFCSDWERSQTLTITATYLASFPQPDSDGMPDWWELANGLDSADASDASGDSDLLNDGDEVNDFTTNPNNPDTDADGLSDADEVLVHLTSPLLQDSDADLFSDLLEVNHFHTDPNDAANKPATLINFVESFENTFVGWITPLNADAGWSVTADLASNGSKSLHADALANEQTAEVEWHALFNQSTLTFEAKVSSGGMWVFVDGAQQLYISSYSEWQPQTLQLSTGFHTIKFVYQKYYSSVSDGAWIDNIRVQ